MARKKKTTRRRRAGRTALARLLRETGRATRRRRRATSRVTRGRRGTQRRRVPRAVTGRIRPTKTPAGTLAELAATAPVTTTRTPPLTDLLGI